VTDQLASRTRPLPPGQRAIAGFPRFGTHLHQPPPTVPAEPTLTVAGAVRAATTFPLSRLDALPQRRLVADFHCVAGWTATDLTWEGVAFADLHREMLQPLVADGATVTHVVFVGLDGYRSIATVEDALGDDVVLARRLNGKPLDADHGAPLRLVSPSQYGFVSTKHLSRIELHTGEPNENYGYASTLARVLMLPPLFKRHPRSRVWHEERNRWLPAWSVRPIYRLVTPPIRALSGRRR
jgi:DMSO/TMAO reductase YedYZ molybdopterin-dependent catalytic subunit